MPVPDFQAQVQKWRRRTADRTSGHAYVRLAEMLIGAGREDEALETLEEGVARGPVSHGALLHLGRLLLAKGRDIEARSHLLRLLGEDPGNTRALAILAEQARTAGRREEAARFYRRLVELEPTEAKWSELLGEVSRRAAEGSSTDGLAEGAGRQPTPTMTLVDIYLAQGYRDRALSALQEMAALDPGREDVKRRLAEIQGDLSLGARSGGLDPGEGGKPADRLVDPARLAEVKTEAARRRAAEKQMFQSWVRNLRRGREQ